MKGYTKEETNSSNSASTMAAESPYDKYLKDFSCYLLTKPREDLPDMKSLQHIFFQNKYLVSLLHEYAIVSKQDFDFRSKAIKASFFNPDTKVPSLNEQKSTKLLEEIDNLIESYCAYLDDLSFYLSYRSSDKLSAIIENFAALYNNKKFVDLLYKFKKVFQARFGAIEDCFLKLPNVQIPSYKISEDLQQQIDEILSTL